MSNDLGIDPEILAQATPAERKRFDRFAHVNNQCAHAINSFSVEVDEVLYIIALTTAIEKLPLILFVQINSALYEKVFLYVADPDLKVFTDVYEFQDFKLIMQYDAGTLLPDVDCSDENLKRYASSPEPLPIHYALLFELIKTVNSAMDKDGYVQ